MSKKLSSLLDDDTELRSLRISFNNKLKVTQSFKSRKEFISQELERIQKEFLEPLQISIGGDFRVSYAFNFTVYLKYAYDWLSKGHDYELDGIYHDAKMQYSINPIANFNYNEVEFKKSVYTQLLRGATYLKYEKFLKRELDLIAKPWWKKTWIITTGVLVLTFTLVDYVNKSFDLFKNFKSVTTQKDSIQLKKEKDSTLINLKSKNNK